MKRAVTACLLGVGLTACSPATGSPAPDRLSRPTPFTSAFPSAPSAAEVGARLLANRHRLAYTEGAGCLYGADCLAFRDERDGVHAAYFRYIATYSDTGSYVCGVYVFQDAGGWHLMGEGCGTIPEHAALVAVSAPAGCAQVREAPGTTGRLVGCLKDGSAVYIDRGPIFVDEGLSGPFPGHIWWHVRDHGWMAHDALAVPA